MGSFHRYGFVSKIIGNAGINEPVSVIIKCCGKIVPTYVPVREVILRKNSLIKD